MDPITGEQCAFLDILGQIEDPPGERGRRRARRKRELVALITDSQTARYRIDARIILGMIQNDAPVPPEMATNIRWPHPTPIYIEYRDAIRLDPDFPGDETPEFLKANIIIPGKATARVKTIGTKGAKLLVVQHVMHLERGTVTNPGAEQISQGLKGNDARRAQMLFARLAAYTNAFTARMPNQTAGPPRQAAGGGRENDPRDDQRSS